MGMSKEEARRIAQGLITNFKCKSETMVEFCNVVIEALEQEPRKDEVILTKEEYGELVSSEFDNGYAKGYREALEQEPILDKIRAEIDKARFIDKDTRIVKNALASGLEVAMQIIDKYKGESEKNNAV